MSSANSTILTTIPPSSSGKFRNPNFKTLIPQNRVLIYAKCRLNHTPTISFYNIPASLKLRSSKIRASGDSTGETGNWLNQFSSGALAADKIFRLISGATASPIAQFISSPTTFLHSVDPRIKLVNFILNSILVCSFSPPKVANRCMLQRLS